MARMCEVGAWDDMAFLQKADAHCDVERSRPLRKDPDPKLWDVL